MEAVFASLSRRQSMLLLTALTFGGQESLQTFDHLPDDEAELLRHRAEEMLRIPRDRRIPLLVQEIKRLVTARRAQVFAVDPGSLAEVLSGERPALVEVILRALPAATAEAVREKLPNAPRAKLVREIRPEILNIVRWKLEDALSREAPKQAGFRFSDVLLLKSRELLTVCDRLGARALSHALAGLPTEARESFVARLAPDQRQAVQKELAQAAGRELSEADARALLALHGGEAQPNEAVRSAGAQRIARAAVAQSPEFAARVVERVPGAFGQLLVKWIREERPRVSGRIDAGRSDVVAELERLEEQGIIERPVRLAPPKPTAPPPAAVPRAPSPMPPRRAELPGGKVLVPRPRPPVAGGKRAPGPGPVEPALRPYRDPIAERVARQAGIPSRSSEDTPSRDPIAERAARRAGAAPRPKPAEGPDDTPRPRRPGPVKRR